MEAQKAEKYSRKRKKKLLNAIREQIEFYFSDANLRRDRFMRQLVNTDDNEINGTQFVEIKEFLKFNKISEITQSVRDISLAMESSKCLVLDETKLKVKRSEPFLENKDNSDENTIYVERLPPHADQQWIRSVFETYGRVEYVKVPRFRHNNSIMGFAFVEFDSSEAAQKACRHFGAFHNQDNNSQINIESESESKSEPTLDSDQSHSKADSQSLGKRTLETNDESICAKKVKLSDETQIETKSEVIEKTDIKNSEVESRKKKNKRRRKRKTFNADSVEENQVQVINLRVMSKKEWKSWKNKYLKLQKTTMSSIKQSLGMSSVDQNKELKVESNKVQIKSFDETFESGLIIKLNFIESSDSFNEIEFKRRIRSLTESNAIAYIDLPHNQIEFKDNQTIGRVCYIRCKSSQDTNQLVLNEKLKTIGELCVLSGDEESNYWNKINEQRMQKRSNTSNPNNSRKNIRGFDKIISKAEKVVTGISTVQTKPNKHIKFDSN